MNDPNGMVCFDGEYHLFYQYNPHGNQWGHMSWGHAVSRDLVQWEHLPLALAEERGVMIFSGSAVVDWKNTSGFGKNGQPPLVAIYTGHYTAKPLQNQQLAYSNDRGRTWTKFSGNPVLDIGEKDFRDPKVFWHEPTSRWIMAVSWSVQRKVRFYSSANLKDWKHLSDFGPAGSTEGIWECPDLFPLSLENQRRWVLLVNVGSGAPAGGSGCQYFVGDFDGKEFKVDPSYPKATVAEPALWLDRGPDCYAAVTWSDVPAKDGRRIALGWMSNWQYANDAPTSPWRSAMTVPRELRLQETAGGIRLLQRPVEEQKKLRGERLHFSGGTVDEANAWIRKNEIRSGPLELTIEYPPQADGIDGVKLFKGENQGKIEEVIVGVDHKLGRAFLDRTKSGGVGFHPKFSGVYFAPRADPEKVTRLHFVLDACSVEVFVDGGEQAITALTFPSKESHGIEFFGPNPQAKISAIEAWKMSSSWK